MTFLGTLSVLVLALDQATKALAVARLSPGEVVPLVGDLLRLRLIRNGGAAFSMGTGATWVLTVVALGIVVLVIRSARRLGSRAWALALGLLLGGALGNLVDRLVREPGVGRGHVVDFIGYGNLFIGNVADIAIVVAAALMAILSVRGVAVDGARVVHHAGEHVQHRADHRADPYDRTAPDDATDPGGRTDREHATDPQHRNLHHHDRAGRTEEPASE